MWPANESGVEVRSITSAAGPLRLVASGPASGTPVLLLHGWGASVYSYRHTIRALAEAGYRAISLDLPGHGCSDKPIDAEPYREPALLALIDAVLERLGIHTCHVIGQSMGGRLALDFALTYPARVKSVYVINPIGTGPVTGLRMGQILSRSPLSPLRWPLPIPRIAIRAILWFVYGSAGRYTERDIDEYWAPSADPRYGGALARLLLEYPWTPSAAGAWRNITVPVHLVLGASDRLVRARPHIVSAVLPASATVEVVPRAGHIVQEETPGVVNRSLLAFLAKA